MKGAMTLDTEQVDGISRYDFCATTQRDGVGLLG
jgi:hypothetical protein